MKCHMHLVARAVALASQPATRPAGRPAGQPAGRPAGHCGVVPQAHARRVAAAAAAVSRESLEPLDLTSLPGTHPRSLPRSCGGTNVNCLTATPQLRRCPGSFRLARLVRQADKTRLYPNRGNRGSQTRIKNKNPGARRHPRGLIKLVRVKVAHSRVKRSHGDLTCYVTFS